MPQKEPAKTPNFLAGNIHECIRKPRGGTLSLAERERPLRAAVPMPIVGVIVSPTLGPIFGETAGPNHAPNSNGFKYAARFKSRVESR
jgi:hypothetical protein